MNIEKNIPIPAKILKPYLYPFEDMEVGDSFRVSSEKAGSVRSSSLSFGVKNSMKFAVRKHEEAYRCWRIA